MPSSLNPRYTFANFVVGRANDHAAAGASAVAAAPGRVYNPLFIYGATGLGKTHLMQAVAHEVAQGPGGDRLAYVTAGDFRLEVVEAVRAGAERELHARYLERQMLLMDDLHTLRPASAELEAFVRIFTALQDAGRQVLLTSDRPATATNVEAEIARRFRWGKIVDLGLPDFEHRLAILRHKVGADALDVVVPDAVLALIAEHVRSSVRALEGAVTRLVAIARLRGERITVPLALEALQIVEAPRPEGPQTVQQAVAQAWGTTPEALVSARRSQSVVEPRQIAMLLCREVLRLPLAEIGAAFGGRDHTTVHHSVARAEERLAGDDVLRERVERIRRLLRQSLGRTERLSAT